MNSKYCNVVLNLPSGAITVAGSAAVTVIVVYVTKRDDERADAIKL